MGAMDLGALKAQGRQVAIGLAGTLGAALIGLCVYAFVTADSRECLDELTEARDAIADHRWAGGVYPLRQATRACGSRQSAEIASMRATLDAHAGDMLPPAPLPARTLSPAEAEVDRADAQDRAAGYLETKENYVASSDLEKLKKAVMYASSGDKEGFALLVKHDPDLSILPAHVRVKVFEHSGFAGIYAHARAKGTLTEVWIKSDGLTSF